MKNASEAGDRYRLAIDRNLSELQRAIVNRTTMQGIELEDKKLISRFLEIIYKALFNDYVAHCMKVFERGGQCAGFWYIRRVNQRLIDDFVKSKNFDLDTIEKVSGKLKIIRDKTHFHIDQKGILNTQEVWREAGLTGSELSEAVDTAWSILRFAQDSIESPATPLLDFYTIEHVRRRASAIKKLGLDS